jgi:hypothetical protein
MPKPIGQPYRFGQSSGGSLQNYGAVTPSPWLYSESGNAASPWAYVSPPVATPSHLHAGSATPGPAKAGDPFVAGLGGSAETSTLNINTGTAGSLTTSGVASDAADQPLTTGGSTFNGGSATATDASDLNALITAADSQTTAGTLTINISGSIALNTLPAVANGETLAWSGNHATPTAVTAVPDIAAVNLHSGVSLVIVGTDNAVLDGGNTVRGLFAYAGNLTVDNLTIQNTVAQGGAGGNSAFAGGGGAGLGGGLFVAARANVTLNSVSFSANKAFGGAGGDNTGGAPSGGWAGGGGLGGNGGITDGGIYMTGGGGVGRTAFGGDGDYKAVTTYVHTDDRSLPGAGIIVGGASGGNGAPIASGNDPHTSGASGGGGGGISEGTGHSSSFTASALGYYGAGAGAGGVGGHNGYSKLSPYNGAKTPGGGGQGGFGGGGGGGYYYGGFGGFGGGGGGGQYKYGGNGGFGGGGGGLPNKAKTLALGGFGAGNAGGGYNIGNYGTLNNGAPASTYQLDGGDSGGGGLGAGGAIFVQSGGVLNLGGAGTVNAGTVVGGAGGVATLDGTIITSKNQVINGIEENGFNTDGTAGSAFGSGIFIQNNSTSAAQGVTLSPGSGQLLTVSGVIADEQGSGGTGSNATAGKLVIDGGGTVRLTGANTFAGGSSISASSTLDLGASGAAGSGAITFASGSTDRLIIESTALPNGTHFSNTVSAFAANDVIDLSGLTFHAGATANIVSNTLSVVSNGVTDTLTLANAGANLSLLAVQDAGTGTEIITANFSISTEAQLLTDLGLINSGGADAATNASYTFDFLNAVPLVTGGETLNLLSGSSVDYTGTGFTTGGTMTVTAGEMTAGAVGALGSGALAIGASGTAALNGFAQTIGDLSGSGEVLLQGANLTEGTANSTTFSGAISGAGGGMLIKQGTGTLTLSGTDTLPGGLTINAGKVVLGSSTALNGGGSIAFGAAHGDVLEFNASTMPSNTIVGFVQGQTFDVNMTGTTVTGATIVNTNTLQISLSAGGPLDLKLDPTQNWTTTAFNHSTSGSDNFITERAPPVVVAGATVTFNGGGPAVIVDSGLTVSDPSSPTLASATVSIASGFLAGDTLTVGTPGDLGTSFSNGTLTLSGTANLATYQTALDSVTYSFSPSTGDPTNGHSDNGRIVDWTVNDGTQDSATVTSTIDETPCYCHGTRILTDHGATAVEDLHIGDRVVTLSGAARPIRWIGHRHLDLMRHPAPERVQPIRIRADAVAGAVPCRDLRVSPDHAVLLDGVLVPARLLVNGASIERDIQCDNVTYYHVELETHDILLAEALPAESFLDTGNRGMFENADEPLILHPVFPHPDEDDGQRQRIARSCRPIVDDAAGVETIWRRLANRAMALGYRLPAKIETTGDPGLHVVMGGRAIRPVSAVAGRYTFVLPRIDGPARLASRAARPCEARPWVEDRRLLGVRVSRLTLRHGTDIEPIALDHPNLSHGWWDLERDRAMLWRWTDGDAVVPLSGAGPAVLEIVVTDSLDYPLSQAREAHAARAADLRPEHSVAA